MIAPAIEECCCAKRQPQIRPAPAAGDEDLGVLIGDGQTVCDGGLAHIESDRWFFPKLTQIEFGRASSAWEAAHVGHETVHRARTIRGTVVRRAQHGVE